MRVGFYLLRWGLTGRTRVAVSAALGTPAQRGEACAWLVTGQRLVSTPGYVRIPAVIPQWVDS